MIELDIIKRFLIDKLKGRHKNMGDINICAEKQGNYILIVYFSGTGNTNLVVNKVAAELESLGNKVKIVSCESSEEIDNDFDILGIAFPIHSSYAPSVFKEFLNKLPDGNDTPLFGIVTSGYMAGDVLTFEGKSLEKRGYKPFLYRNIIVGNNLHLPVLCPLKVTKKEKIDRRLVRIDKQIKDIALKVNDRTKDLRGNDLVGRLFGAAQRSIGRVHEEVNFKGFTADDSCIKCLWCVNNCPSNNIVFENEKVVFGDKCIKCMRCYNFCPNRAIQMTKKTKKKRYVRYRGPEGLGCRTNINKKRRHRY